MDGQKIASISRLLELISWWSSIYEMDARRELAELRDLIYDLQLDLQATVSVLPVLRQETQAKGGGAAEQFGAGTLCAIPSLPDHIDGSENQVVSQVQLLMETLSEPITPEQLSAVLPILKSIPPLIDEFLKIRDAMMVVGDQPPDQSGKSINNFERQIKEQVLEQYKSLFPSPQTATEEINQILQLIESNTLLRDFILEQRKDYELYLSWLDGLDLDDGSSPDVAKQVNPQDAEDFVLGPKCKRQKVHDRQCNSANYPLVSCQKMNPLVEHVKNCKKRKNGDCSFCERLRFFYSDHASLCQVQDNKCSVPFCFNIKQKLKELPQSQQLIQMRVLRYDIVGLLVRGKIHSL